MSGKGDTPRPIPDRDAFERNWDAIFGKKQPEPRKDAAPVRHERDCSAVTMLLLCDPPRPAPCNCGADN